MKRVMRVLLVAVLCLMPCSGAEAVAVPGLEEFWEQAEDSGVRRGTGLEEGLSHLLSQALDQAGGLARLAAGTGLKLLAVVLLCALARGAGAEEKKGGIQTVELTGVLAITALTMTDMATMIGLGRDTIGRMDALGEVLLPVMAVLTAASGGITAAAARQGATVLFSQVLLTVMDRLLVPMVYAYVAVSCAQAAVDNQGLGKLAGLLKGAATFVLTSILLAFVAYLTASGAVAGTVDASAVKAARMAISRAIPVVGSILADASETVLAGAGVLRGTVGVAGMLVVLTICLTPFLRLALQYLVYKTTAALCGVLTQSRLSQLIDAIGGAFGMVLGMTGAAALILLVSLVSALSAVAP